MMADVPWPPKKPDTTPEVVATYCLPPSSYVTTPPPTVPPVLNLYSVLPLLASSTRKLLSRSPVKSTPPDVAVIAATSGVGHCFFQRTLPVVLSIAAAAAVSWRSWSVLVLFNDDEAQPNQTSRIASRRLVDGAAGCFGISTADTIGIRGDNIAARCSGTVRGRTCRSTSGYEAR